MLDLFLARFYFYLAEFFALIHLDLGHEYKYQWACKLFSYFYDKHSAIRGKHHLLEIEMWEDKDPMRYLGRVTTWLGK